MQEIKKLEELQKQYAEYIKEAGYLCMKIEDLEINIPIDDIIEYFEKQIHNFSEQKQKSKLNPLFDIVIQELEDKLEYARTVKKKGGEFYSSDIGED